MATRIRMYDCAFGDCFRITHQEGGPNPLPPSHLYVDFGIHSKCTNDHNWKEDRYDRILAEMPDDSDFLLSHYHYDHYSGVLYMMERGIRRFRNVYIPDVWNIADSVQVVWLLLLRDALTKTVLSRGVSLFRFLNAICHATGRIYFVKRGDFIQTRYVALWPTEQKIQAAAATLAAMDNPQQNITEALREIANELCNLVREISQTNNPQAREPLFPLLADLERRFLALAQDLQPDKALQKKLADFGHRINIIFQNRPGEDRNILFTGDAEKSQRLWRYIRQNEDGLVPFYSHYHVIKIPHHGTEPHYHNFRDLTAAGTAYLITNRLISCWPVARQYSEDANAQGARVYCCDNNTCAAYGTRCNCLNHHLICPCFFRDL